MPICAVIFDLDGVLIDSAQAHRASWEALAAENGLKYSKAQFSRTFGLQNRDIIPLLWGRALPANEIETLGERKEALYRERVRGRIRPLPGAVELVRACHDAGMVLALGSSTHPENVALALDELGISRYFTAAVSAADIARGKPHPDVFLEAARQASVRPQEAVVVEDAPAGIEAALAAGCMAVGITSHHPAAALSKAHLVVYSLLELSPERLMTLGK